jgi:outer membrane immunogenic protein
VSGPVGTIFRSGAETSNNPNGALVGITLGYNYQFAPNWVFGVEGDFDGAGISGTRQFGPVASANPAFFDAGQVNTKISWLATLRGRLGYTWGPGMIYVTGGGAWEDISIKGVVSEGDFGTSAVFNNSKTQSGWTVGGGYEWMFVPNWSAKIEYLYYQFNNNGTFGTNFFNQPTSFATITDVKQHLNTVRVGVNYHF